MTQTELNILIRVQAAAARAQLAQMQAAIAALNKTAMTASRTSPIGAGVASGAAAAGAGMSKAGTAAASYGASARAASLISPVSDRSLAQMASMGSRAQWTGRQLSTNFTAPLALAAGFAVKWELDNERAMTSIQKVYGDTGTDAAVMGREIGKSYKDASGATQTFASDQSQLGIIFTQLSNHYGTQKKEVLDIASAWASAGASGASLARATELTLKTMVVGNLNSTDATQGLIAIQAQYKQSTEGLANTIATLNVIENTTAITTDGLITGFSKVASVAKQSGTDVRHLGAMMATLVPSAGSAANAGTGLKSIIQKLMDPTKDATQLLGQMGINVANSSYQALNASERIELLARKFKDMNEAQKSAALGTIAGLYQVNRLGTVIEDVALSYDKATEATSTYKKALDGTVDPVANMTVLVNELNTVLESNPQKFKQVGVIIQNAMTKAIIPLIPMLLYIGSVIAALATKFSSLNPGVQKLIILILALVASVGPIIILFASLTILFAKLGQAVGFVARLITGPFGKAMKLMRFMYANTIGVIASFTATFVANVKRQVTAVAVGAIRMAADAAAGALTMVVTQARAMATMTTATIVGWARTIGVHSGAQALILGIQSRAVAVQVALEARGWLTKNGAAIVGAAINMATVAAFYAASLVSQVVFNARRIAQEIAGSRAVNAVKVAGGVAYLAIARTYGFANLVLQRSMAIIGVGIAAAGEAAITAKIVIGGAVRRTVAIATEVALNLTALAGVLYREGIVAAGQTALAMIESAGQVVRSVVAAVWVETAAFIERTAQGARAIASKIGQGILLVLERAGSIARALVLIAGDAIMRGIEAAGWVARHLLHAAGWAITHAITIAGQATMALIMTGGVALIGAIWSTILFVLTSPIALAVVAVVALMVIFRDEISKGIQNVIGYFQNLPASISGPLQPLVQLFRNIGSLIGKVFNMLPQSIQGALISVVTMVKNAALKVYELFSYMNPFARHSPSLVENVTTGMSVVGQQFGLAARNIAGHMGTAYRSLSAFGRASAGFMDSVRGAENAAKLADIGAVSPGAVGAYQDLQNNVEVLTSDLDAASTAMDRQGEATSGLERQVKNADTTLEHMKDRLQSVSAAADQTRSQIDAAKTAISDFASAPLAGMTAMDDAIFANSIAQKKLQLQMLGMKNQPGYEDAASKVATLAGEIEKLRATQSDLRSAGAGSDITAQYDAMIAGLQGQISNIGSGVDAGPMDALQKQLDDLTLQAQKLDLEKALQFDPLTRQVDKLSNGMKELPFDTVVAGITASQAQVISLTAKYDQQTAAVREQQAAVDAAQVSRDALSTQYDVEKNKLDALKTVYDSIKTTIDDSTSALNDMASAATNAVQKAQQAADEANRQPKSEALGQGTQNYLNAAGVDFATVAPTGSIGREGTDAQNQAQLDAMIADLATQSGNAFGGFDMFGPIKDMWNKFTAWWTATVVPIWNAFTSMFSGATEVFVDPFGPIKDSFDDVGNRMGPVKDAVSGIQTSFQSLKDSLGGLWDGFMQVWGGTLYPALNDLWQRLLPSLNDSWGKLRDGIQSMWDKIRPALEEFKSIWPDIQAGLKAAGVVLLILVGIVGGALVLAFTVIVNVLANVVGPIFSWLGDMISGVIGIIVGVIRVFAGVWQVILGIIQVAIGVFIAIFTGNMDMLKSGFSSIVSGLWDVLAGVGTVLGNIVSMVISTFINFGKLVWGIVAGIVQGIIDFFIFLWDVLVGHSIIPDTVNAIVDWFKSMGKWVSDLVSGLVDAVVNFFTGLATTVIDSVIAFASDVYSKYVAFKDGLIAVAQTIATWVSQKFTDLRNGVVGIISEFISTIQSKWDSFSSAIQSAADVLKNGAVEAFRLMGVGLQWVFDNVIAPAFNAVKTAVNAVKSGFETAVQGIKSVWETLTNILSYPVRFLVNTVYNDGVKPAWNAIASKIGLGSLPDIARMATGGGVHGPGTSKSDSIPAMLSNGEHVIPAKEVQQAGGQSGVYAIREMIRDGSMRFFANGGAVYEQMFDTVRRQFPQANLNSGYRPGANDMHGQGKAVDLGQVGRSGGLGHPYLADMNRWIADNYGKATYELIYDGFGDDRDDIKSGRSLNYGNDTQAQHRNHVHWAMQSADALGGASGGIDSGSQSGMSRVIGWLRGQVANVYDAIMNPIAGMIPRDRNREAGDYPGRFFDSTNKTIHDFISGQADSTEKSQAAMAYSGPAGVEKWRNTVLSALDLTGQNSNLVDTTLRRMNQESGGDWRAINNWDINAANGTPSKGLMQVIDPTFASYRNRSLSSDIYDPLSNIVASMNYTISRYGSLGAGYNQAGGYDNGGWMMPGERGMNFSRTPEPVFTGDQWSILKGNLDMEQSILQGLAMLSTISIKEAMTAALVDTTNAYGSVQEPIVIEKSVSNTTNLNFYGDLSFPSISSGDDAGRLIDNLKSMAGS